MIKFRCPECQQKIGVDDSFAGKRVRCTRCGDPVRVPATSPHDSVGLDPDLSATATASLTASLTAIGDPSGTTMAPAPFAPDVPTPTALEDAVSDERGFGIALSDFEFGRMVWPAAGALTLLGLVLIGVGYPIGGAFMLIIALSAANGFWIGAGKIAAVFGGMLLAVLLAAPIGRVLEGPLGSLFGAGGVTKRVLGMVVAAVLIVTLVTVALQFVVRHFKRKHPDWVEYEKMAGGALGLIEGVLLSLLLMWAVLSIEPIAATSVAADPDTGQTPDNPVAEKVVGLAEVLRESAIGHLAAATNPLSEMRLIVLFEDCLLMLNDPVARETFAADHVIAGLEERPPVRQALDLLANDPLIAEIIDSDGAVTGADLRTILDSETILTVLDETDVVDELSSLAPEIEAALHHAIERSEARSGR